MQRLNLLSFQISIIFLIKFVAEEFKKKNCKNKFRI